MKVVLCTIYCNSSFHTYYKNTI